MKRPASQFYWGDWLNCQEVRAVSLAARGLWIDMLCYMRQGEPLGHLTHRDGQPINAAQLARMVGDSQRVVGRLLAELESAGVPGKADNGAYTSRRMLRDEQDYQRYRAGQAEAGKRGAAERWGSPSPPYPDPMKKTWGQHGSSSSSSSPSSASASKKGRHNKPGTHTPSPNNGDGARVCFDQFWKAYPKKVGKDAAWRAWQKRHPDAALLQQMLSALTWQTRQEAWGREDGRFIPNPSTWINQGRWEDEPSHTRSVTTVSENTAKSLAARKQFLNHLARSES